MLAWNMVGLRYRPKGGDPTRIVKLASLNYHVGVIIRVRTKTKEDEGQ